ncbi:myosin heavy chain, cardiac muscle isoform-like isoform X2 [Montipora foliosa]|uniref:myosin heavy chain, cardiac muscle isoform-like isoform X2 n=1 Tax=Montipora foliosa TaxID=591990 RepID=UPI0035F15B5A
MLLEAIAKDTRMQLMERKESLPILFHSAPFRLQRNESVPRSKFQESKRDANRKKETLAHVAKEREWRRQKSEYESYIMALEAERDSQSKHETEKQVISSSRETTEKTHFPVTLEEVALKNQTKAVLLAELVSMELFYGLEDLLRIGDTGLAEGLTSSKLYNLTDKDLLLHSAETLLELTEYFFAKSSLSEEDSGRNLALKKLDSEVKTERPSRLLAQGHGELLGGVSKAESSYERKLFRVRETLCRLKRTTDSASLGFLSRLLDAKFDESEKGLQEYKKRLYELLKHLVETQTSCSGVETTEEIDPLKLEQSLCHVLMDKALLNCLLLLDKADMESRIKTLDVQTFDYTGLSSATPVQCDCSSQSSDDFGPSSPLSGARNLDVRLTSVDEGVVLESSSESANSREKLAAHLENTMEELEGENKRLYEKNEELRKRCEQSENENSELSIKLVEYETKLERSERKLSLSGKTRLENTAVEVQDKMEEREFEACVLSARMEDLEYKLKTKDKTISVLKQNEKMLRGQLFEQRKRTEDVEEQNAKLQLKVKQAEEKFEQSELKLASYTGSEMLESRKITKQLESLIVENKELALKILKLEEEKSKVRDQNDGENKADFSEDQKKMLEKKIINLEVKLKDQEVKILSVKEYERRIRAELCKEMTKKLTKAQTQTRQLGEKIFELESKLREAEQQYSTVRGMDTSARSAMRDGIKSLTDKLRAAECRNRELSGFVQDAEERLLLSQRKVLAAKQAEIDMREKVQLLELENCRIKERTNIRKEEKIIRPSTGRTADRLEKLRKENSNLSLELKCFRENILKLERDLLKKDEEILTLRNDSVDLSSEVCKLRSELDESNKCKNELKKKITTCSEAEQKLVARLAIVQEELNKLETSKAMQVEQAANGDWSASSESTLLIGEINFEDPAKSVDSSTFLEETSNDEMVKESQMHDSDIAHELDGLQVVNDKLRLENLRVTEKNEILKREMKSLEENLSVVEKAFQACRSENECLLREVNLKSSKATTEGTHASFCTEKAGELRSEIGAQRQSEISLEKRLADLENESICMREEIGHGMLEFTELREKKGSLEKKVSEASLVVDHLKKEILDLINGLLTLQRNLNLYVDKMLACLGLEETSLQPFRVGLINGSSTPTEESSSDASSEISETFSWKSAFSFRLLPDKEGFLNPSDVSTIRESKAEIIRVHEDLKAKILAIKDALSRLPIHAGDENVEAKSELDGKTNEFGANLLVDTSKSGSVLPRLCRAERVKLSSLLSRLKEELVRERKTSNDGRSEGNDLCTLYDNLESKLSRLSCELALREDEITILVTQRKKLQDELEECEKGLIICCHCASKIPNQIEENRQQLKGKLLSHIEDTSWLESEIWGFMEYRQKLESELDKIKGKVINMEDELDVRKILMKRCNTVGPEGDERDVSNSDSSKEDTDDFRPSLPGKKRKSQKHVTFENVDISESEDKLTNKRRRQKSDTVDNDQRGHARSSPDDWLETDMDSSDVDLCELLASIPRDIPKKPPSPEELEIAEIANRLSGYDNMSFDDKLQYATLSRKTEQDLEYTTDCKGVLSNGNNSHSKTTHDEVVEGDDAERITCQMCGLFRKRS